MKVYRVNSSDGTGSYIDNDLDRAVDCLKQELNEGESATVTITIDEMTDVEFSSLPEFDGL